MLSLEFYMYSTLQSLCLVSPYSIPSASLLLPFGEQSLLRLPQLPTDLSPHSLATSFVGLLTSPGALVFLYGYYLRPQLEERIYRLIRRRLPKSNVPDELSVRVAFEENLIEWVVPTLGRRSDEELHRSKLTLIEDIKCEIGVFRRWIFSFFGLISSNSANQQALQSFRDERIERMRRTSREQDRERMERIESMLNSIEMLQHEPDGAELNIVRTEEPSGPSPSPPGITLEAQNAPVAPLPPPQERNRPTNLEDMNQEVLHQVLTNENRMSQSPGEMSNDYFSELTTVGRTSGLSTTSNPQGQTSEPQNGETFAMDRQNSRSNTLFSRPSSPETSPPTSPRVRASLIHQNSDIITMQLELLGNRNRNLQTPASNLAQLNALAGNDSTGSNRIPDAMDRRSIAEFLEALILSQAQRQVLNPPPAADADGLSNITAGASNPTPHDVGVPGPGPENMTQDTQPVESPPFESIEEALEAITPNVLPDGVEEPNDDESSNDPIPAAFADNNDDAQSDTLVQPILPSSLMPGQSTNPPAQSHRVTLLSAYPVDALASHLAAALSGIILAPLEALYLRSLSQSWLIRHPSSTTRLSDLHPLGLWFGGSTWSDIGAYTGRMVLMRGMQIAMRAGIWGFLVGSTMRIGRNFCGWGKL
jgi:hypothetical protein